MLAWCRGEAASEGGENMLASFRGVVLMLVKEESLC